MLAGLEALLNCLRALLKGLEALLSTFVRELRPWILQNAVSQHVCLNSSSSKNDRICGSWGRTYMSVVLQDLHSRGREQNHSLMWSV